VRIIAGIAKGMPLAAPKRGVRPTADRIREAIFSSLGEKIVGADALDLFAGTGALGLEAASRGARSAIFVENGREALKSLQRNIENFRKNRQISCEISVRRADVFAQLGKFSAQNRKFSLIFADPPYGETAQKLLADKKLPQLLSENGLFVLESARRDAQIVSPPWKILRETIHGDTRVSILCIS
jgi:16S rRNA (guanine966-N2)-methyltransferase